MGGDDEGRAEAPTGEDAVGPVVEEARVVVPGRVVAERGEGVFVLGLEAGFDLGDGDVGVCVLEELDVVCGPEGREGPGGEVCWLGEGSDVGVPEGGWALKVLLDQEEAADDVRWDGFEERGRECLGGGWVVMEAWVGCGGGVEVGEGQGQGTGDDGVARVDAGAVGGDAEGVAGVGVIVDLD